VSHRGAHGAQGMHQTARKQPGPATEPDIA